MPPFTRARCPPVGGRLAGGRNVPRHARQPDIVEEGGGVVDQRVVLVRLHEGLVLRRFQILESRVGRHVESRHAVVAQPDGLGESGPDVDHVGDHGVPVEVGRAAADRLEGLAVVVGHLLVGEARVLAGELGDEGADRDAVRLLVAHGPSRSGSGARRRAARARGVARHGALLLGFEEGGSCSTLPRQAGDGQALAGGAVMDHRSPTVLACSSGGADPAAARAAWLRETGPPRAPPSLICENPSRSRGVPPPHARSGAPFAFHSQSVYNAKQ